jgi:hypothetical protein
MPTQACDLVNRGADGNCLDISDSTEDAEVHELRVLAFGGMVKPPSNDRYSAARSRAQRGPRQLQYPSWAARYLSKTSLAPSRVNVSPS